jgi:hypothetical protein
MKFYTLGAWKACAKYFKFNWGIGKFEVAGEVSIPVGILNCGGFGTSNIVSPYINIKWNKGKKPYRVQAYSITIGLTFVELSLSLWVKEKSDYFYPLNLS